MLLVLIASIAVYGIPHHFLLFLQISFSTKQVCEETQLFTIFMYVQLCSLCEIVHGRIFYSINCSKFDDQKLKEILHVCFVFDDKVYFSCVCDNCYTLPWIEWQILEFVYRQRINMFSHQPKSTWWTTVDKWFDVFDSTTGRTWISIKLHTFIPLVFTNLFFN